MKIGYKVLKKYIHTCMYFYYTKMEVHGKENIPHNKPVMLLANHQNALLDPLVILINCGIEPYFLARSDLFKNPILSKFLHYIQMMPIYRFRDGVDTLKNNPAIFNKCGELLLEGKTVMLFPEGNHGIQRRVRLPMRKGFTRMLFSALEREPDLDIRILPVGLNYDSASEFPDKVSLYIGENFKVQDYYSPEDLTRSEEDLKAEVYKRLVKITTHIDNLETYDNIISQLEHQNVNFQNPIEVNTLIESLDPKVNMNVRKVSPSMFSRIMKIIFTSLNLPFLLPWKFKIKHIAKDIEFRSTLRFLMGLLLFPFYLCFEYLLIATIMGQNIAIAFVLTHVVFNLVYVKMR